jgi:stage III sporulation protein AG
MVWLASSPNILETVKKYRYVIVVLLIGLFLMLIPQTEETKNGNPVVIQQKQENSLQEDLEQILSQLEGAGRVEVLLTQAQGERRIFQTNDNTEHSESAGSVRKETVIVTDSGRGEDGLVQQTVAPVYLGAVILCQGAGSAAVRLAIIEAVSSATGLPTHNISVLKMK